jgi:hypothetical protein
MSRRNLRVLNGFLLVFWTLAVGFGMAAMWRFDTTPGIAAESVDWPLTTTLSPQHIRLAVAGRDTLVMLVHPRCPCSRASIENLADIMARTQGRLVGFAIFYEPSTNSGSEWDHSDLVALAGKIKGVTTVMDPNGELISKFHGKTSGQTLVYDGTGHLVFNGGITPSRGECGDSTGTESIVSITLFGAAPVHMTPVYGCALQDTGSAATHRSGFTI